MKDIQFRIRLQPNGLGNSWVEMNGERLKGVRAVAVYGGAGVPTTVALQFVGAIVDIDGITAEIKEVSEIGEQWRKFDLVEVD